MFCQCGYITVKPVPVQQGRRMACQMGYMGMALLNQVFNNPFSRADIVNGDIWHIRVVQVLACNDNGVCIGNFVHQAFSNIG